MAVDGLPGQSCACILVCVGGSLTAHREWGELAWFSECFAEADGLYQPELEAQEWALEPGVCPGAEGSVPRGSQAPAGAEEPGSEVEEAV